MKTVLRTAGAIVAAGMALAACGSASHASTKSAQKKASTASYGWINSKTDPATGLPELMLPHAGLASPTIDKFATKDYSFYKEIINPQDWVYSKTFSRYIFVGPYTKGLAYLQVRDAKILAIDLKEILTLFQAKSTAYPTTLDGFNYRTYGQWPSPQAPVALSKDINVESAAHFSGVTLDVPSEATIVESPVGPITPKMADNNPAKYQTVPGTCVPHAMLQLHNGTSVLTAPYNNSKAAYFVQYTNTNKVFADGQAQSTADCTSMP